MAKPEYDNELYVHTLSQINNALPMEYAIRVTKQSAPDAYQALIDIDNMLHEFWRQKNFNDDEIEDNELKDFSWDYLQTGKFYSRSFSKIFQPDVFNDMQDGLKSIFQKYKKEVADLRLPLAASNFRYCDLLNGNDIPRVLVKVKSILNLVENYPKESSIPLKDFANFIRIPVRLHNDSLICDGVGIKTKEGEKLDNSIILLMRTDKPISDFKAMLNEFSLEYCKRRMAYIDAHPDEKYDPLPRQLITEVLHSEKFDKSHVVVKRHDGLMRPLVGLYCWDFMQEPGRALKDCMDKLKHKLDIKLDDDTITRYYGKTNKKIKEMADSEDKDEHLKN